MQLVLRSNYFMDLIEDLNAKLYVEKQFAVDASSVLTVDVVFPDRFAEFMADGRRDWFDALPAFIREYLDPVTGWVLTDILIPSHENPNLSIRLRGRNPLEVLCDAPPTSQ